MNRKPNRIVEVARLAAWLPVLPLLPVLLWASSSLGQMTSIVTSKHNLTASGPGPIRIVGAGNVCSPCHTSHASNPIAPLWNRFDSGAYYQVYSSPTLTAEVPQPTGSSRLCLSCHDGTIALGQTYNPRNQTGGSLALSPSAAGYLGTDLRDDHPISFVYDSALALKNGQLNDPSSLPAALHRDRENRVQCTTCHDPHDNSHGYFLTMDNTQSQMCKSCHNLANWSTSGHANSSASIGSGGGGRWQRLTTAGSVRDLACEACHRPHSAGGREWLLYSVAEEDNCYACHNGTIAKNVSSEFLKVYRHSVEQPATHSPNENPATMTMHVKCGDCHNPHQAAAIPAATAPLVPPQMKGVSGVQQGGATVATATYEYEVCYKCHASRNPATPVVNRVISEPNIANRFSPSNLGFHPVAAVGKNLTTVPSLISPRRTTDRLYCTSCHGSDSTTVRGPHGSTYSPLLILNDVTIDNTAEG
ncbi:MAG: cytochrome c3 family protein, partial [Phycisphaerae bacterium]|nr:cytochrome c3 family protein [Phycisphaerae bacterium]